jgi:RHS repeat-associated protein
MTRTAHIHRSPDKPGFGIQPILPGLGVTDRPTPLLLEEKGPGDEVDATKKGPGNDSVSLSVSIEEKGPGDDSVSLSVSFEEKRPGDDSVSLSVSIEEKGPGDEALWPVEQRSITSYYTPYTFSAKERDPETGYSYFGARYYDADISVWLSVDPMAHKYPSMSAYMYCAGNPVMLVDPDGNYIFKLFGSTRAQRQAAREYAENTNGQVHRLHRKSIYVEYHQALPGYISSSKSQLPITILCIVTFNLINALEISSLV